MSAQVFQKLRRRLLILLARRLSTCKEATGLLSQGLERRLSLRQRASVQLHLLLCSLCRRYDQQLHFLKRAAAHYEQEAPLLTQPGVAALSAEARARMKRSLQAGSQGE